MGTDISYHIISYHIISYHIRSYHIISYHMCLTCVYVMSYLSLYTYYIYIYMHTRTHIYIYIYIYIYIHTNYLSRAPPVRAGAPRNAAAWSPTTSWLSRAGTIIVGNDNTNSSNDNVIGNSAIYNRPALRIPLGQQTHNKSF